MCVCELGVCSESVRVCGCVTRGVEVMTLWASVEVTAAPLPGRRNQQCLEVLGGGPGCAHDSLSS